MSRTFSGFRMGLILAGLFLAIVVNITRFVKLDTVPPGAQVDELSASVTLQCLASEGVDAHGRRTPLFSDLNYGSPLSPNHLYAGAGWVKVFGSSVTSLRILSGVYLLAGIAALFLLAHLLFGLEYAAWTVITASVSPWVWSLSRIAFESLGALPVFILGLYFCFRSQRWGDTALAVLFLVLAMYAYPPMRLSVPLLLPVILIYKHYRHGLKVSQVLAAGLLMVILLLPLAVLTLNGSLTKRFSEISIFAPEYLFSVGKQAVFADIFGVFLGNLGWHFSPEFLFLKGGGNGINLARGSGIFAWHDILALLAGCVFLGHGVFLWARARGKVFSQGMVYGCFCVYGFLVGVVPAALTTLDLPNALRMIGSWPFAVLLIAFIVWRLCQRHFIFGVIFVLTGVLFSGFYLSDYFKSFPQYAGGWFQPWVKEQALAATSEEDWLKFAAVNHRQDYHVRYYMMQYHKETCSSSREKYEAMGALLRRLGRD